MLKYWVVVPTCLPLVLRRCHVCASEHFRASGKFRVNANHKLIDVWLLALCTACGKPQSSRYWNGWLCAPYALSCWTGYMTTTLA